MNWERKILRTVLILLAAGLVLGLAGMVSSAQIPLSANKIPQFVNSLPTLTDFEIFSGAATTIKMQEFKANVLPANFIPGYTGTWVWGYRLWDPTGPQKTYLGPIVVAQRGVPTEIKYENNLGTGLGSNLMFWKTSTDQTLHWADPLGVEVNQCAMDVTMGVAASGTCAANYPDMVPAVPHLHGGEVPPVLDGGPDAWFTDYPLGSSVPLFGHAYYSRDVAAQGATPLGNWAIYRYPNTQEGANIWFHDHALGITRLNVYAGLAGAYIIYDPINDPPNLPDLTPLVIQDRMFDTTGQLFFPNIGINVEHPFWIPEFVGDTILVNGKVWPFLSVDKKRYSFLLLNGSNARTYDLSLIDLASSIRGPRMWVIATDGGYLDKPVLIDPNSVNKAVPKSLVIMPGERYEVIIDFNDPVWQGLLAAKKLAGKPINLILRNTAKTPYPGGAPADQNTTGRIMQFRVSTNAPTDNTFNPATPGVTLRGGTGQGPAIVRLVNPATGTLAAGVTASKTRQLTLNEIMGAGGPLEILLNNTKLTGEQIAANGQRMVRIDFTGITVGGITTYYSELPEEGTTEVWEIVNLTADAHPIHTHLTQVQLLNRQNFDVAAYNVLYAAAFGGLYIPAYGPPLDYYTGNARALGGNPDVTPTLKGAAVPPLSYEAGWKDTIVMYPGQVTRIAIRYAPTDKAITAPAAELAFPFSPDGGHGYVWHCHIIDHEDNEMMRPLSVQLNVAAPIPENRLLKMGTDY